mmetsp:Transcript_98390/g.275531  ORF Transcript_98390/g.275531 Transcript_98390/m.275531 type:complete len:733 (-) Transcript_98390:294-2492(-)
MWPRAPRRLANLWPAAASSARCWGHAHLPLLRAQDLGRQHHGMGELLVPARRGDAVHAAPQVVPEGEGALQILDRLHAAWELCRRAQGELRRVAAVLQEVRHDDAHAGAGQHERWEDGRRLQVVLPLRRGAHEAVRQQGRPLQVQQEHRGQGRLHELAERSLQDADQRVEGREVEVDVGVPHVALQLHRHQRHDPAQEERRLRGVVRGRRLGVVHVLGETLFQHGRLEGLGHEHAELEHLERHEAGLLEVGRRVLQRVAEHGHVAALRDVVEVLEDHQVHERRERVEVVRHGRVTVRVQEALDQRAVVVVLVRVPGEAKLKVNAVDSLPLHLRRNGIGTDVPLQAAHNLRLDNPGILWQVGFISGQATADDLPLPERLQQDAFFLEERVQVAGDEPQGPAAVRLQLPEQVPELLRVHERLRLVRPLPLRQGLGELVGDDAHQHEVVEAVRQLLAHDGAEVVGHLRGPGPRAEGADTVVLQVQNRGVLHQNLADAVAVDEVVFHLVGHRGLHEVGQRGLLDHVNRGIEVEPAARNGLELREVEVGVREAVLGAREHAGVHELVARDVPLLQDRVQVNPLEEGLAEVDVDDDGLHAVEEEARGAEDGRHDALLREVRQLRAHEVGRLQALVASRAEVVKDEVHEVPVDAARRDREALLRLRLPALRQVRPSELHLLVHAADEHRVLRSRRDALEDEERCDVVLLEGLQLLVHEPEDPRRDAAQGIGKRVLQRLN